MNNMNLKKAVLLLLFFFCTVSTVFSQTYVNKEWTTHYGSPTMLQWSQSIRLSGGTMATVGNTAIAGQGANILLSVYKSDGSLNWSANYNHAGTFNDYGTNLVEDLSGNIYVCGMTDNGGLTNADMVILKYTSGGTLVWDTTYNSPYSKNDIATGIVVDTTGKVYVCGMSEGDTTQFDYVTIGLFANGGLNWASRYDYVALQEYALGITLNSNSSLIVTGASASSASNWDYTTLRYTLAGVQASVNRSSVAGSGYDQPYAYIKDNSGNVYITGKGSTNGTDYNIKTIKLSSNLTQVWNVVYTGAANDDQANAIAIDQNLDLLVGGYTSNTANEQVARLIKYDNNGNQLWEYDRHSDYSTGHAQVKAIDVDTINNNEIYVLIENTGFNNTKDLVLVKLDHDGNVQWERTVQTPKNEYAIAVKYHDDGSIWITYSQELGVVRNYTVEKYMDYKPEGNFVYNSDSVACYRDNQLIVRFARQAVNKNAVDNTISNSVIEFEDLSYFLTPSAYTQVKSTLNTYCGENDECPIRCLKIFKQTKTIDSLTVTRLGDTIRVPEFWASFILEFPQGTDIYQVHQELSTLSGLVAYSHPNYLGYFFAGSNELEYNNFQYSLHYINSGGQFDNAHINIEPAWDIVPSGGKRHIRCGVFDTGINWGHEDFGFDGSNLNSSKVVDGWNFDNSTLLKNSMQGDISIGQHGTKVSGIIGAIRNNNKGIAGIAGGNYQGPNGLDDKGIALYSLRAAYGNLDTFTQVNDMVNAIKESTIDPIVGSAQYNYKLNIQNHSWGMWEELITGNGLPWDSVVYLLRDAVEFANRQNVTVVCARGNYQQVPSYTQAVYPACYDDDWVINVAGTGRDGHYSSFSNATSATMHDKNVDVGAPASTDIVRSLQGQISGTWSFGATSAAAPHVSGVVGLLMSYMNNPLQASYSDLAPEDCEHIIEMSATDNNRWWDNNNATWYGFLGYDSLSGWGKLNAGRALQLVEKPHNTLYHFGSKDPNSSAIHNKTFVNLGMNDTIYLNEPYENSQGMWFPKGYYKVNRYQLTDVLNYTLNPNDTIVGYWARNSGVTLFPNWDANKRITLHHKLNINSMSLSACNLTGYYYEVMDLAGNPLGWWPKNYNIYNDSAQVEISILAHDKTAWPNGVKNEYLEAKNCRIFPNPSFGSHRLEIYDSEYNGECRIQLLDLSGRVLYEYSLKSKQGNNYVLYNNTSELSKGFYVYKVILGDKLFYQKLSNQ